LGEGKEEEYLSTFRTALRTIIWISLPVAVIAYFARGYVVSFIKNGGDQLIASVLATLVLAIFARSVFHIASRGFYARQDTKTPFVVSIVAVGLSTLLAILFTVWNFGPEGLGFAQSIGAVLEIIILLVILNRRSDRKLFNKGFWKACVRMLIATAITGAVTYSMTKFLPLRSTDISILATLPKFAVISFAAVAAYIIAGYFLDLSEVQPIIEKIKKWLFRNV
ncbi:polysaccharide biosynthesis C-terminal domain-containing protein, partial [Candidatus Saccharibacteria bacterium]|nr:polysaccharide biosynthesis C-terminal domain-containing protein [Candidatus Saccharibacteria bacterium]